MKNRLFIYTILLAGAALLLGACVDHRRDNLDEFKTMVYFRNGGEQSLTLFRTGEDGFYKIPVCKSGSDLEGSATAVVLPFDEARISMYNISHESSFKLIPHDLWSFVTEERAPLSDQTKVDLEFGKDDPYKLIFISLNTTGISALLESDPYSDYIIGFQVFADERVSSDINVILLKPDIEVPYISLLSSGEEPHTYTSADASEATYHNAVSLNIDENRWDFSCSLTPADAAWLENYNRRMSKSYELLPASAYKLSTRTLEFKKGDLEVGFDITINREAMEMLIEYALPIVLDNCTKTEFSIDPNKNVYLLNVRLDPDQSTITSDMISVSHNEEGDGGGAPALVDDDVKTFWHSPYSSYLKDPDPVYGVYVDIALKSPLKAIVFEYVTRAQNSEGNPSHIVIGVSDDKSEWTVIGEAATDEMASAVAAQTVTLPVMKHTSSFKYIRFGIAESLRGDLRVVYDSGAQPFTYLAELHLFGTDN